MKRFPVNLNVPDHRIGFYRHESRGKTGSALMKLGIVALILVSVLRQANCQENSQQITAEFERSKVLAVKLYPDCTNQTSALSLTITKMDLAAKADHSPIYNYPGKPLTYAIAAATLLKIEPNWSSVTEGERNEIFALMAAGLANTRDLAVAVTPQSAPAQDSFNPGSMNPTSPIDKTADAEARNSPVEEQPFNPGTMNSGPSATTSFAQSASTDSITDQSRIAGFHCYLYSLEAQSSGLKSHLIDSHSANLVYSGGPLSGMSKTQANEYAIQMWQQMSPEDQMAFVNQARTSGDPIAQQQAAAAAAAARGPTGATIYNSDGTVSQVQYH